MNAATATTPTTEHDARTAAWALVLRHQRLIRGLVRRWGNALGPDERREMEHDLILRLVEQYPRLRLHDARDPEKVISTWIGFQARAVQTRYGRSFRKVCREHSGEQRRDGLGDERGHGGHSTNELWDAPDRMVVDASATLCSLEVMERTLERSDAHQRVEALYAAATPPQKRAILAYLMGLGARRIRQEFHMSLFQRDGHLRALGNGAEAG